MRRVKHMTVFALAFAAVLYVQPAYAQDDDYKDELQVAALVHLCKVRAQKSGLTADVKLWEGVQADYISAEAYKEAAAGLNAVDDVIENAGPIVEARCEEGKRVFLEPDADHPGLDPQLVELNDEMAALIYELSDELKLSGYGPDEQKILLEHFVALGNHYGLDNVKKSGVEGVYAYGLAVEAVRAQRKALNGVDAGSGKGKALLSSSNFCIDGIDEHLFTVPPISDEGASAASVRHLLFQGLKHHRRAIGGGENQQHNKLENLLNKSVAGASTSINKNSGKVNSTVLRDTLYQTSVLPLCMQNMSSVVTDLVAKPLQKAEKKVSRRATK